MRTLVTGASGFVGHHVARLLCGRGDGVRLMVRAASRRDHLKDLPAEFVEGDLRDVDSLRRALRGCRRLFHVAAVYTFSARDPNEIYAANVEGTRNILQAAMDEGVERIVYTSTVGALATSGDGAVADERTPVTLDDMVGHYKRSKYLAQEAALEFARRGAPVVIVNPSGPVGPFDAKPTPTGKMIVDFLRGKMPGYVDTGMNMVAVEDVAEGHLLAAERGRVGETYILGHRNMHLREIGQVLAQVSGLPAPRWRVPHWVATLVAAGSELKGRILGRPPAVPLESVRLARHFMYFDPAKAVRELGLPQTPVEAAFERAVRWFRENGYA